MVLRNYREVENFQSFSCQGLNETACYEKYIQLKKDFHEVLKFKNNEMLLDNHKRVTRLYEIVPTCKNAKEIKQIFSEEILRELRGTQAGSDFVFTCDTIQAAKNEQEILASQVLEQLENVSDIASP